MVLQFIILIFGLGLLWTGAELLIKNSSTLARSLGVSPVIIGLTIVSIGTSLPEFVVSFMAAIQNTMGISIGNIIGSNIANIGLILGLGALLSSLAVKESWIYKEVPAMIAFTVLFIFLSRTGYVIARFEGLILLFLLMLFLFYLSRSSMIQVKTYQESAEKSVEGLTSPKKIFLLILSLVGVILLVAGSKLTVSAGEEIARSLGVSETVIGLSLIAVGTSLPELATTIVGIINKETDIVVGNVVGSNIFNLLFIGGVIPIIRPIPIEPLLFNIEFPFLLGLSLLVWPIMRFQWNVHRYEGLFLLCLYLIFIGLVFAN